MKDRTTALINYSFLFLLMLLVVYAKSFSIKNNENFLASDGAIKYYQLMGSFKKSLTDRSRFECYYPGETIDPQFKLFPYRTNVWGLTLNVGGDYRCYFHYPLLFTFAVSIVYPLLHWLAIFLLPVLFYILSYFIFTEYVLLSENRLKYLYSFLLFTCSFPLLSTFDFSEVTMSSCAFVSFLAFIKKRMEKSEQPSFFTNIFLGFFIMFAVLMRPETAFSYIFFSLFLFTTLFSKENLKPIGQVMIGGVLCLILAIAIYQFYENTFFGIRFAHASSQTQSSFHIQNMPARFWQNAWGDKISYGYLKSIPWLAVVLLAMVPGISNRFSKFSLAAGRASLLFLFLTSAISPYFPGVGYFANRFYETGCLLAAVFLWEFLLVLQNKYSRYRWAIIVSMIVLFYAGYRFNVGGFKHFKKSAKEFHKIQQVFRGLQAKYLVHTSDYTNSILGKYYLTNINFFTLNKWEEKLFIQKAVEHNIASFTVVRPLFDLSKIDVNSSGKQSIFTSKQIIYQKKIIYEQQKTINHQLFKFIKFIKKQ